MADRICSACGQGYKDNERHNYELCYEVCEARVNGAIENLKRAWDCLNIAEKRRDSQRKGLIK